MSEPRAYVLVTAAYNEEAYIEATIRSVVAQTVLPLQWAIVSDGSTDRTDEIVSSYAARYPFIRLVRVQEEHARNFAAQVLAINLGCKSLQNLDYQLIANLDSDITLEPTYYQRLIEKFDSDPTLGLAGGFVCEKRDGRFEGRTGNREYSVPHAVQMFRRECFESIGGYCALPYGGPDWHALISVQMHGWRVQAFRDLPVFHHRPTGGADRRVRTLFREGRMDYSVGSYPPFEIFKLARRAFYKPYVASSLIRLGGFLWGYWLREARPVSPEFVQFLRNDQKNALRKFFHLRPGKQAPPQGTLSHPEPRVVDEVPSEKPVGHSV